MFKALALSVLVLAGIASLSAHDGAIGSTGGPSITFAGCMYSSTPTSAGAADPFHRHQAQAWQRLDDEISSFGCKQDFEFTVYQYRTSTVRIRPSAEHSVRRRGVKTMYRPVVSPLTSMIAALSHLHFTS